MGRLWSISEFLNRRGQKRALREEDERERFIVKYRAFREALRHNNEALRLMGDMQEKASGAYAFDTTYVRSSYDALSEAIKAMVDSLNLLADNQYDGLNVAYHRIDLGLRESLLTGAVSIPQVDYVLDLERFDRKDIGAVGGKFAYLGELTNRLGQPVPPGFVITTRAYQAFVEHNGIERLLERETSKLDLRDYRELESGSAEIRAAVEACEVPPDVEQAILDGYHRLCRKAQTGQLRLAVRSSAVHEDVLASFAGQYDSALNVSVDDLVVQYRRVLASQFTPRALVYYKTKGFPVAEMAMATGVLALVPARTSGIVYSRDPGDPSADTVLASAVWGLGSYAVGGVVHTENFRMSGSAESGVERDGSGKQRVMLIADEGGGTREVGVPDDRRGQSCLSDAQARALARSSRELESHFGRPQDTEWALDQEGRLFLLQSRPMRMTSLTAAATQQRPTATTQNELLLDRGTIACRGAACGPVHVVRRTEELAEFPAGGVLVVRHTHPEYAVVLDRAAAVVADIGTALGHLATVAREYDVPALFNTENATKLLRQGQQVTVDAVFAAVYAGRAEEILRATQVSADHEEFPALRQLRELLHHTTPLNLTDPRAPEFVPRECRTFHDITRFVHEVALRVMFETSRNTRFDDHSTKRLVSRVPLEWWVIDLEDGIAPGVTGKKVHVDEIVSIPLRALWDGMIAVAWEGPPPVDTKGFASVMFSATTDPSMVPAVGRSFADKNYMIIAKHFCNVSTRLGFHFSTTEAYIGDAENENYISFVYSGGGADSGRKERRARLISRLLEQFDFRVERSGDSVFARLDGHGPALLEERMKVLGHIMVHTRQMDMAMYNDAMVEWYFNEIMKGIGSFIEIP